MAAEEIFELFERTIADYEEKLYRNKEENERREHELVATVADLRVRLHKGLICFKFFFFYKRSSCQPDHVELCKTNIKNGCATKV